jgi:hypothetical protein
MKGESEPKMVEPLSREQVEFFRDQGYLVAPGLIDPGIVQRAEATLWELLGAEPDNPEGWPRNSEFGDRLRYMTDEAIYDLYTPRFSAALQQLTGRPLGRPEEGEVVQAIVAFPTYEEWRVFAGPHVDNAVEAWELKTFPTSQRGNTLIYLADADPQGGGTAVWPGWHRKLVDRMQADPHHYELLYTIQHEIESGELQLGEPVVLTPRAGDLLVLDPFMPHAATVNVDKRPRFMITRQVKGDQRFPDALTKSSDEFRDAVNEHTLEYSKQGKKRAYAQAPSFLDA